MPREYLLRVDGVDVKKANEAAKRASIKTKLKITTPDVLRQAIALGLPKAEGLYK